MKDSVYSVTEVYGSSDKSIEDAVKNAVETAATTLRNIGWFEVTAMRGHVEDGKVAHFQVGVKLGFRYEQ